MIFKDLEIGDTFKVVDGRPTPFVQRNQVYRKTGVGRFLFRPKRHLEPYWLDFNAVQTEIPKNLAWISDFCQVQIDEPDEAGEL